MELCKECQKKFDKQKGELRVMDMCEKCRVATVLSIVEPEDKKIH